MPNERDDAIRDQVRKRYAEIAKEDGTCCGGGCCCSPDDAGGPGPSTRLGYSGEDLAAVPDGADMGLGCGDPRTIAGLGPGETVLDLGCGGGLDCFLAARRVGESGRVIGVDMTPEMISKARSGAREDGYRNVEFRLGEIEHLPVADGSVDVIISNCVINLSPDKEQVFREAFRVLRPGGRLAVSDVVLIAPLPEALSGDVDAYCGCVAGAARVGEIERMLKEAGFSRISVDIEEGSERIIAGWLPGSGIEESARSASITAWK